MDNDVVVKASEEFSFLWFGIKTQGFSPMADNR